MTVALGQPQEVAQDTQASPNALCHGWRTCAAFSESKRKATLPVYSDSIACGTCSKTTGAQRECRNASSQAFLSQQFKQNLEISLSSSFYSPR